MVDLLLAALMGNGSDWKAMLRNLSLNKECFRKRGLMEELHHLQTRKFPSTFAAGAARFFPLNGEETCQCQGDSVVSV
jgi:hypothetical protein